MTNKTSQPTLLREADGPYLDLLAQISDIYIQGRMQAVQAVNTHITQTYWHVGRQIVEFEQGVRSGPSTARRLSVSWLAT